jgi:protein-L-isoaspartate(D-aspartate) O-methyltransferase
MNPPSSRPRPLPSLKPGLRDVLLILSGLKLSLIPDFGLRTSCVRLLFLAFLVAAPCAHAQLVFETTSPYHHIRIIDSGGFRTLCFDDALETCISLKDPLAGHYEYTEYFHMPWLWNTQLTSVLIVGLGGGSSQRAFEHYYPSVTVESVEIDPVVLQVAQQWFGFKESSRQKVHIADGRMYLRRSKARYDLVVLDAYVQGRYGSCLPQHLATREFFELVRDHLTTNGVVAYNVIGSLGAMRADLLGAMYRTLNSVFPQVYLFSASTSQNVVFVATRARGRADLPWLRQRALALLQGGWTSLPKFLDRLQNFRALPPPNVSASPILTDDYAPVEGLSAAARRAGEGLTAPSNQSPPGSSGLSSGPVDRTSTTLITNPPADPFARLRSRMVSEQLVAPGRNITNARVVSAMAKVPRHEFVPDTLRLQAYADGPLPIGQGQTISQPYIVAFMTEQLDPKLGERILEIGTGSGYQAALLSELGAEVYTLEIVRDLARRAAADLSRLGYTNVHVRAADGFNGWPDAAPFDAIIVTCAPEKIPAPLTEQLKPGGRMILPVGTESDQRLVLLTKDSSGKLQQRAVLPVRFVPMTRQLR